MQTEQFLCRAITQNNVARRINYYHSLSHTLQHGFELLALALESPCLLMVAGDQLLKTSFQGSDFVFVPHRQRRKQILLRWGGDELVQLLETTVQAQAEEERAQWRSQADQEKPVPQQDRAGR